MQVALGLEKSVNQSLLDLHAVADSHKDAQVRARSLGLTKGPRSTNQTQSFDPISCYGNLVERTNEINPVSYLNGPVPLSHSVVGLGRVRYTMSIGQHPKQLEQSYV